MSRRLYLRLPEDDTQGPESDLPAHSLRRIPVPAALAPQVAHILRYRESIAPGVEVREHVLPDGVVRLIVEADGVRVIGAAKAPATVLLRGRLDGWSITLRPGACPAWFGVAAGELAGRVVPLASLRGEAFAAELQERFVAANDDARRVAVLERMLPSDARPAARTSRDALAWIARAPASAAVRDLAAGVGLGERRLQQLFHDEVGVSPRAALRLSRFQGLLRALRGQPRPAWADLAIERGFFDQPHLVNEFRMLSGMTPGAYAARAVSRSSKTAR